MDMPKDGTLFDWYAGCAMVGALAGRYVWPATERAKTETAAECFDAARAMLAARGTPAPALDESAIRKDERKKCDSAIGELILNHVKDGTFAAEGYAEALVDARLAIERLP